MYDEVEKSGVVQKLTTQNIKKNEGMRIPQNM